MSNYVVVCGLMDLGIGNAEACSCDGFVEHKSNTEFPQLSNKDIQTLCLNVCSFAYF